MRDEFEEHLDVLRGQDKATGTIQQYSGGFKAFTEWLDDEGLEPREVETGDVQRYLARLSNERGYAPKTVRGYYSAISGFYADRAKKGDLAEDPTEDIILANYAGKETRKAQETKERRVWLSEDELSELVNNVPAPQVRNRLLVLFQYYTGLRRQEVVDVELGDLDRENRTVQVRGKGDKLHTVHWRPRLDGLLSAWLDDGYRSASPYADESDYLFLTESGPRMRADTLNKVVVRAAENAGIQEVLYEDRQGRNRYKYTSHALRHSFAMHWLQNGGSIEALSHHMAHNSVTTTEIYGEILDERAKDEYDEFAPDIEL